MRTGLCTISQTDWELTRVVETAAEVGFDGVEIWGKEPHVGDASPERCEEIAAACADAGVDVAVYGSYLRPGTESYDDGWEAALDATAALGADHLRVWAGDVEYGDHDEGDVDAVVSDLRHLSERAADRDVAVTVEKHEGTLTFRDEGAERVVEGVDRENCGLNWQPTFADDADAVLESARRLAPLTNNVHLQAVPRHGDIRTTDVSRCLLSEAYFDLDAVLDAFAAAGFDGYVEVEFVDPDRPYRDAVADDYATIRECLGN